MSQPEKKETETLEDQVNAERLRVWREKRAALAETSRTERIRLAEADRQERLKAAEEERAARARDAAEKRARDLAAERAERMAIARAKLAGRADIDAARERLQRYRARAAWALMARLAGFVALPTLLVALYLFAVATPLYRAEATLALAPTATPQTGPQPLFSAPANTSEAFQLRAVATSPKALRYLDETHGLTAYFGPANMDPVAAIRDLSAIHVSVPDQLGRYVSVDVLGYEGLITLNVLARSPEEAEAFAHSLIGFTTSELRLVDSRTGSPGPADRLRVVVPPVAGEVSAFPDRIGGTLLALAGFFGIYILGTIFIATMRRHADA